MGYVKTCLSMKNTTSIIMQLVCRAGLAALGQQESMINSQLDWWAGSGENDVPVTTSASCNSDMCYVHHEQLDWACPLQSLHMKSIEIIQSHCHCHSIRSNPIKSYQILALHSPLAASSQVHSPSWIQPDPTGFPGEATICGVKLQVINGY